MGKVKELHTPIERKRHATREWEFQDSIGQYEIHATEYVIDARRSGWKVKAEGQTYWAENGNISLAKFEGPRVEKFADPVDVNLRGCIGEALGNSRP